MSPLIIAAISELIKEGPGLVLKMSQMLEKFKEMDEADIKGLAEYLKNLDPPKAWKDL